MSKQELWLDYSFARPSVANMKALGYEGVMRYLSLDASKNLTKTEAIALRAAGLKIGLVWETTANRASAGRAAGVADAKAANAQADALGYPKDAVLFYAVDFDATPAQVQPYFEGAKSVPGRPVGLYGGIKLTAIGLASYNWQTVAWSNGNVDGHANLYQRLKPTVKNAPSGTDENVLLNPFPAWGSKTPKPAPQPAPKPQPAGDLTVIGWNCYVANKSDITHVLQGWIKDHKPDVICLSEARTHEAAIHAVTGYKTFQLPAVAEKGGIVNEQGDSAILIRNGLIPNVSHRRVAKMRLKWVVTGHNTTHTPRQYEVLTLKIKGRKWRIRSSHWPTHGAKGPNRRAWLESAVRAKAWSIAGVLSSSLDVGDFNEQVAALAKRFGPGFDVVGSGIDGLIARNVTHVTHTELDKGGSDHHGQMYQITVK